MTEVTDAWVAEFSLPEQLVKGRPHAPLRLPRATLDVDEIGWSGLASEVGA